MTHLGRTFARRLAAALITTLALTAPAARAQFSNPVYLDDSTAATEAILRAGQLASAGNLDQAARVLQQLLVDEPDRVVPVTDDPDLYLPVRSRIHLVLLANPALLDRYRAEHNPIAQRLLEEGDDRAVEGAYLLTTAGFDAALRVAQRHLEGARFWASFRTLQQLEHHPDRAGLRAGAASHLLHELASYLNDPDVVALDRRWASTPTDPKRIAPPVTPHIRSPYTPLPHISFEGLLSKPLASESLRPGPDALLSMPEPSPPAEGQPPLTATVLRVMPTVMGDTIYVNTGDALCAFDRLTLVPRWPAQSFQDPADLTPLSPFSPRDANGLVDHSSITVDPPYLVAISGLARDPTRREGDPRVHAFNADTGERLWSIDVASLDPSLSESWARGPAVLSQGVVTVCAVKYSQQRRLTTVQLVGLDAATGNLLWRRPLASAGILPFGRPTEASDLPALHEGAIYRVERIGVISAVDAATGRVLWARRSLAQPLGRRESRPWEGSAPLIYNNLLITPSPDRRVILTLDRATGKLLAESPTRALGSPEYLLLAGRTVLAVNGETGTVIASDINTETHTLSDQVRPIASIDQRPYIRGRVVVAEDRVLIPTATGLTVAPVRPNENDPPQRIALDRPGVILPLPDQLLVADDWQVHSYLLWDAAQRMLTQRIHDDPSDPTPAVTFAELAYRADRLDAVMPSADLALKAITSNPASPRNTASRERLFRALLTMIDPGAAPASSVSPTALRPVPLSLAEPLTQRLAALASTPTERAAAAIATGAVAESLADPRRAIDSYQSALLDPLLAQSTIVSSGLSARADVEAARRLRRVLRDFGSSPYAPFEAQAQRALAITPQTADALEDLARQYPLALTSSRALLTAAELRTRADDPHRAALNLERALTIADDSRNSDPALLAEIRARYVRALDATDNPRAALLALRRFKEKSLPLAIDSVSLDPNSLIPSLEARVASIDRMPILGAPVADQSPQTLLGWRIVEPIWLRPQGPPPNHVLLQGPSSELALYAPAPTGPGLVQRWSMAPTPGAKLVRIDHDSLILSHDPSYLRSAPPDADAVDADPNVPQPVVPPDPSRVGNPAGGRTFMKINATDGAVLWSTPPFRSLFPADAARLDPRLAQVALQRTIQIATPFAPRPITELLIAFDQRTLAIVERSGRAAAFDLHSGQLLWTSNTTIPAVFDVAADAGILAITGVETLANSDNPNAAPPPALIALDMRTGRAILRETLPSPNPRWIRVTERARIILGLDAGVLCYDTSPAQARWRTHALPLRASVNAWIFPGRIVVSDEMASLWQLSEDDGAVRTSPLLTTDDFALSQAILSRAIPAPNSNDPDRAAFLTSASILLYDHTGNLVARDARPASADILPAVVTSNSFLTIDSIAPSPTSPTHYTLRQFSLASVALIARQSISLGADPVAIAALDGRILVTAGDLTVVLDAPPPSPAAPPPEPLPPETSTDPTLTPQPANTPIPPPAPGILSP